MRAILENPRLRLAVLVAAALFSACGDDAAAGCGAQDDKLLPAAALDAAPGVFENERTAAALNFWKPLADRAKAVEEAAVIAQRALDDPRAADAVAAQVRKATVEGRRIEPEFVAAHLDVRRIELGECTAPPRLVRLSASRGTRSLQGPLLHPRSPEAAHESIPLLTPQRALAAAPPEESFGVYAQDVPDRATIEACVSRGARFFLIGRERGALSASDAQASYPRPVPIDGPLPVPFVFVPPAFHATAMDTVNDANESWSIEVAAGETHAATAIVARIRGRDPSRKLVVTCGRDARTFPAGTGTAALEIASVLEVARTTIAVMRTPPNPVPAIDIELVCVLDHGHGYDWLPALRVGSEITVGVVNVQDVVPRNTSSSDVFLTLDGAEEFSALARAFHQTLTVLAGQEGLWEKSGVGLGGTPIPASTARACGQECIPIVRLGAASDAEERTLAASSKYPPAGPSRTVFDPVHDLCGTSLDEVRRFVHGQMAPQVSVARALAFGILRTTEAFKR